jgi:hypothetical protein
MATLPIKTTTEDVSRLVEYLKTKPAGATVKDAKAVVDSKLLDHRKLKAYETWGFVKDAGGQMKLDERGWHLARKPEEAGDVFLEVLDSIKPYRGALEWAHHQAFESVTVNDVAAYWIEHYKDELGTDNETTSKSAVTSFFSLADAAGLGRYILGRRANPTRLEFAKERLAEIIASGPSTPPWVGDEDLGDGEPKEVDSQGDATGLKDAVEEEAPAPPEPRPSAPEQPAKQELRVFIAHGKNMDIVEQVETILGLADIESEYAEAEESSAIPVPEKVFGAMRRCNAGIICVSVDEGATDANGGYTLNENVLIEIGAAFVLYDRRVVLLWDRRLTVPSNLQGLYRCEYEGDELNWGAGMKLMKAIKGFKM